MGAVSGLGDSYDLTNYVGELFNVTKNDTQFFSAIGGLTAAVTGGDIGKGLLFGAVGGVVTGGLAGGSLMQGLTGTSMTQTGLQPIGAQEIGRAHV